MDRPGVRRALIGACAASAVALGGTAGGTAWALPGTWALSPAVTPSASVAASGEETGMGGETGMEGVTRSTVDHDAALARAMGTVPVEDGAEVSVAVLDLASGRSAAYGDGAFGTASIVKVDILAALLLQAQDAGRELTAREKSYATAMIERSDNDSASALWRAIGAEEGLDAANERFGLTGTEGGHRMEWGLTSTTVADQLALLRQVFAAESELSAASRAYVQELMGRVTRGQRWGVSAAGGASGWALKNGWLPHKETGLWDVHSIGRVTADGRAFLVAVLSDGNTTKERGIALVESAARAAVSVFTAEAPASARPG
ncbi:serine hydrolase [Streptomyces sp. NPDC086077]|uniref:serine hydrolase n=1 Tax=Streptomyces sp. NPDC086077 TaxID=3154862 RepID=UPI0034376A88